MQPNLTSRVITDLRLPLAVMVVFIHAFGNLVYVVPYEWMGRGQLDAAVGSSSVGSAVYDALRIFGSHVVTHIAVPTFFVISGYLFFIKAERLDWAFYRRQWRKRVKTLLIPYVIWNVSTVLFTVFRKLLGVAVKGKPMEGVRDYVSTHCSLDLLWKCNDWGGIQTVFQQVTSANTGPALVPMWFIRDLICVVIISPLLAWLLKKTRGYILLAFAALYLLQIQTPVPDMFQTTCLFFSLGAWFALRKQDFAVTLAPYAFFLLVLWVPLLVYNVYWDGARTYEGLLLYPLMVVVGVFAVIALSARRLSSKEERRPSCARSFMDYASRNTFFIYAAHGLFALSIISPLENKLAAVVLSLSLFRHPVASTIISMAAYLLIPFLAVVLCLAVLYPLQRYTPRLAKVLTGAR